MVRLSRTHRFLAFSVVSTSSRKAPLGIVLTAAGILSMRMLGLFMVVPVLALFLSNAEGGANPLMIGLVLGGYGLTQALLQIPLGRLSDRYGRRLVIAAGLLVFIAGSLLAATADGLWELFLGRLLQGAGAVSGVVMALVGDASPPRWRSLSMALVGMAMGGAFLLALVIGPYLGGVGLSLSGYFVVAAAMGVVSLGLTGLLPGLPPHARAGARDWTVLQVVTGHKWWPWNVNVFVIHMLIAGCFVALPLLLEGRFGMAMDTHGHLYLTTLLAAAGFSLPLLAWIERRWSDTASWPVASLLLVAGLLVLVLPGIGRNAVWAGLTLFFAGFNMLEAGLPGGISRRTMAGTRGLVMGVFASHQFLGAFAGGVLGGALLALGGPLQVLQGLLAVACAWAVMSLAAGQRGMPDEYVFDAGPHLLAQLADCREELLSLPGVVDVNAEAGAIVVRFRRGEFRAAPVWDVLERAADAAHAAAAGPGPART